MTTNRQWIDISGIVVEVVRKEIKNLHVGVYPPDGHVRVAAPLRLDDEALRVAVVSRLGWIRRKRREFEGQARQSQREMVSGESHYFRGRRYLLDVIVHEGLPWVRLQGNGTMQLRVKPDMERETRELLLQRWYRRQLRQQIPSLLEKWEPRVGVDVAEVRIRKMKTLWGSCNVAARRIWLNLELAKKSPSSLEFIVVHEMVHLLERRHDERFQARMDALLPSWRLFRDELNQAPLGHEAWDY